MRLGQMRLVARAVILAVYLWAGLAMMAGQDLLTNPIFGFVFVWLWVGGLLMFLGTFLAAFPGRRRRDPLDPVSAPVTTGRTAIDADELEVAR